MRPLFSSISNVFTVGLSLMIATSIPLPQAISEDLVGGVAYADDDDWFDDEDDTEDEWERMEEGDSEIDMSDDPEIEEGDEEEEGDDSGEWDDSEDLLDDDVQEDEIGGEGFDNARIFRAAQSRAYELGVEEELIFWEQYLENYPNTLFRVQVDDFLDSLGESLYAERIDDDRNEPAADLGQAEIRLASPLALESIDPRNRMRLGFEWGFPNYMNLLIDYEQQLQRDLSVHGGMRNRIAGWSIEGGVKYAFVKSRRTNTLVTAILDAHLNTGPAFLSLRPVVAYGKRVDMPVGNGLDINIQVGADLEFRSPVRVVYVGGFNLFYWATPTVGAFVESSFSMKGGLEEGFGSGNPFAFNLLTFGLRFQPSSQDTQVAFGANVPYAQNYWGHHYGAIQGDFLFFGD